MKLASVQKQLFFSALALFTLAGMSHSWNAFAHPADAVHAPFTGATLPPPVLDLSKPDVAIGPTLPPITEEPPPTGEPPTLFA